VTADDIRVAFFNPVLKIFVGFTAFLSALVAADRVFHLYVAFYWKYLSRKGYLDKFKRPNGKRVPGGNTTKLARVVVVVVFAAGRGVLLNHPKRCRPTSNV
jgi:hypothetical protein